MSSKKIIIINPDYSGYASSIKYGFSNLGYNAEIIKKQNNGLIPFICDKILPRIGICYFKNERNNEYQKLLINKIKNEKILAILFVFDDVVISKNTLRYIKDNFKNVKKILWLYDNISRRKSCIKLLEDFDTIFTFQKSDIQKLKENTKSPVYYLPLFYDPRYYYKSSSNIKKDINICFIGVWYGTHYIKRREMLTKIAEISKANGYKFIVMGKSKISSPLKYFRDLFAAKGFRKFVKSGSLSHSEINKYYHRSNIVVNCPIDSQFDGFPIRTFEVPASGTVLVTKHMDGIDNQFSLGDEIVVFKDINELEQLCNKNIEVQKSETNTKLSQNIIRHSVDNRVKEIIEKAHIN